MSGRVDLGALRMRLAESADVEAVTFLVDEAYRPYVVSVGREPAPMTADYEQVICRGQTWVAELDGAVVGVLVLVPAPDHLLLDNLAVAPSLHGSGVGGVLLRLAEDQALAGGLPQVRLYTHQTMTKNIAWYLRRGYRVTQQASQDVFGRVHFAKSLQTSAPAGSRF